MRTPPTFLAAIKWDLEFGDKLEYFETLIDWDEGKVPGPITDQPNLPDHLGAYYEAFWLLSARRGLGGGQVPLPNPLAVSDVFAFAEGFGIDPVDFLRVTSRADEAYLLEAARRAEKALKAARSKSKPRR